MQLGWFVRMFSFLYSLGLHAVVVLLLLVSFEFAPEPVRPPTDKINIVNAVSVDQKEVQQQLDKLKKQEQEKQQAEQERIAELEKKAEELRQQRLREEQQLREAEQKKQEEQMRREEEQQKLALLEKERRQEEEKKKQAEAERLKAEEEKQRLEEEKRKAAEEKARIEAEKQKAAEEKARLEEEKRKAEEQRQKEEEERKRLAAEKALQEQLAAEQAEEQRRQDATLLQKIAAGIQRSVERNFNKTGLPENLAGTLRVKLLPGGEVIDVSVDKSSGNDIFDRRALTAVQKASPLPVPEDLETFERLNLREITFIFEP